jgi:hypothetical protein
MSYPPNVRLPPDSDQIADPPTRRSTLRPFPRAPEKALSGENGPIDIGGPRANWVPYGLSNSQDFLRATSKTAALYARCCSTERCGVLVLDWVLPNLSALDRMLALPRTFGMAFAGLEAKLGPGSEVCQSNTGRSTKLKHRRRFGTEVAAAIAAARIKRLIDSINNSVQSLNHSIETEEERTMCRDCRDPAYSALARSLTARRDNLAATIVALEERLSRTVVLTAPTIGSATDLLLPA